MTNNRPADRIVTRVFGTLTNRRDRELAERIMLLEQCLIELDRR